MRWRQYLHGKHSQQTRMLGAGAILPGVAAGNSRQNLLLTDTHWCCARVLFVNFCYGYCVYMHICIYVLNQVCKIVDLTKKALNWRADSRADGRTIGPSDGRTHLWRGGLTQALTREWQSNKRLSNLTERLTARAYKCQFEGAAAMCSSNKSLLARVMEELYIAFLSFKAEAWLLMLLLFLFIW